MYISCLSILVPCGYYSNLPKPWLPETTEIYSFTIPGAKIFKSILLAKIRIAAGSKGDLFFAFYSFW